MNCIREIHVSYYDKVSKHFSRRHSSQITVESLELTLGQL